MKILGINALNHDAAITLIEDDKILFAAHAERYSGIKNDSNLNKEMFKDIEKYIHKSSDSTWKPSRWIDKVV